jgi:hypothetical protein
VAVERAWPRPVPVSFPSSVTTDIRGLTAEVGPDKNKRQGALGNLLHFGTSKSGPTLPNPQTYLDAAQPKFEATWRPGQPAPRRWRFRPSSRGDCSGPGGAASSRAAVLDIAAAEAAVKALLAPMQAPGRGLPDP